MLQAWLTLPSCLASSSKPTFPLIIFWSFVIVGVLIKSRGRALRNPDHSTPGLGSRFGLMTPIVRSNVNYYRPINGESFRTYVGSGPNAEAGRRRHPR